MKITLSQFRNSLCLLIFASAAVANGKDYEEGKVYKIEVNDEVQPTQIAYGEAESNYFASKIGSSDNVEKLAKENAATGFVGPDGKLYLSDGHHFAKAARKMRQPIFIEISKIYSKEKWDQARFERELEKIILLQDENGNPVQLSDVLKITWDTMRNDNFRSLAWLLRKNDVFEKVKQNYVEFTIANFLRKRIKLPAATFKTVDELANAYFESLKVLALSEEAQNLPGWPKENTKKCNRLKDFMSGMVQ